MARGKMLAAASGEGAGMSGGSTAEMLGSGSGGRSAGDIMENQLSARLRSVIRSRLALPANCWYWMAAGTGAKKRGESTRPAGAAGPAGW